MADVGKGAHYGSTTEDYDILVESTDPDLSRDEVHSDGEELKHEGMEGETMVVTGKIDTGRGKSTVNRENRLLIEVVDPEPLSGNNAPYRKKTGKHEFMEGERGWLWKKGDMVRPARSCMVEGNRWERVAAIGKAKQCQSIEASTGGRKSTWDTVFIIEKVNSVRH